MIDASALKALITVADVLDSEGIPHRRGRCRCPIHGGSNPTSFSFTDELYYCHSCGAKGDVIRLVQELYGTDFRGALEILRDEYRVSGVNLDSIGENSKTPFVRKARCPRLEGVEFARLNGQLLLNEFVYQVFTGYMARLRQRLDQGKIDLSFYYAEEQRIDMLLDDIDSDISELRYETRELRRQQRGKHTKEERLKKPEFVQMKSKGFQSSGDNEVRL